MNKIYIIRIIIDVSNFKMQLRCKKMQFILNSQLRLTVYIQYIMDKKKYHGNYI